MLDLNIHSYVYRNLNSLGLSVEDQNLIKASILGCANGIVLYARLAMNAFLEPDARMEKVLQQLPSGLHGMYKSLLAEHRRRSGVPHGVQLHILQWVARVICALRLLELAGVINVTIRVTGRNKMTLQSTKDPVRAAIGPLLGILPRNRLRRTPLIHRVFNQYH
jgi:hypothetical protein